MKNEKEIWKDVKGFEEYYQVSNKGKVKNKKTDKLLKFFSDGQGYEVYQLSKNGELIKVFPSIREVQRQLSFENSNIVNCCKGRYKTAYGYKWEYLLEKGVQLCY